VKPLTLLALFLAPVAQAQIPKQAQTLKVPTLPAAYTVESNLPTQKVGVDDLVAVAVVDCPELTRTFRVAANGALPLPLLKQPIDANGKYPTEIEKEITGALIREEVLVRPVVSASVVEYRSRPVSVMGAMRYPITFKRSETLHCSTHLRRRKVSAPMPALKFWSADDARSRMAFQPS
jgi:polysaccharide biosynthesis/export protein